MNFIKKWSYGCAKRLASDLKENHEKRRVYYFGFEVAIGTAVKLILLLIISLVLGVIKPAIIIIAVFSSLRVIAGGYHMDTYGKCFTASLVLFTISAIFTKLTYQYWDNTQLIVFSIITLVISTLIIIKWAPSDTPNRPITKKEEIKKFKTFSLMFLLVWIIFITYLIHIKLALFVIAGCFGLLLEVFMLTPIAYKMFSNLSKSTKGVIKS